MPLLDAAVRRSAIASLAAAHSRIPARTDSCVGIHGAAGLCTGSRNGSSLLQPSPTFPRRNRLPNVLDRWLLRQADGVIVSDRGSLQAVMACMNVRSVHLVHPAVEPTPSAGARHDLCDSIGVPTNARLLVGVGPIEGRKGFRDAIWALDVLKYLYDDVFLILVGDGRDRQRLQDFARAIRADDRVRFIGVQPKAQDWLRIADVVWVPSLTTGGTNVALEAMGVGRPVVASRIAPLAEIVVHGESGLAFPPGDKVALARHTHALFQDPAQASKLGEAGRKRVTARFGIAEMVQTYTDLHFGSPAPSIRRKAS